ncbi:MAG TPA: antibiotic biosynthesis monooxygenase [Gemmatimonadaceae bacterium]|nr:antibiotic biosynthesis monooxygenase [Gemmatimonadaceae bacterium]
MAETRSTDRSARVYRVDRFVVPPAAREEFLENVRRTHDLLRTLPGFVQDFVLEQSAGPGEFNLVTFVEWESAESIESAKSAVMAMQRERGFDPRELMARLGIRADIGNYRLLF